MSPSIEQIFSQLTEQDQSAVLSFAEFLRARSPAAQEPLPVLEKPEPLTRPEGESVIRAIKRLSATYHMVNRNDMMNETSLLMSEHVIKGRAADAVIDELEQLFEKHYRQYALRMEQEIARLSASHPNICGPA